MILKKNIIKNKTKIKKPFELYKDGKFLGVFSCAKDLEEQSEILFGVKLSRRSITNASKNGINYKGFTFKRITKEEYRNRI